MLAYFLLDSLTGLMGGWVGLQFLDAGGGGTLGYLLESLQNNLLQFLCIMDDLIWEKKEKSTMKLGNPLKLGNLVLI